jgi:L-fuconolactonase
MEIIDAQLHEPRSQARWPFDEDSEVVLNVELAREAMDCVGIDAGLINARTQYCEAAVSRYPDRFAACPFADLEVADVDGELSTFRDTPGWLALRVVIRSWRDGQLTPDFRAGRYEPVFAAAERHGVPIFIQAASQLPSVEQIAADHPELVLILDHLGLSQQPAAVGEDPWADLDQVVALARHPNVAVKLCGAPTLASTPFPYRDVWPYLLRLVEAYTPRRLMWGSDFTRLRLDGANQRAPREQWYGTYAQQLQFILDTDELSEEDRRWILGASLREILGWSTQVPGTQTA